MPSLSALSRRSLLLALVAAPLARGAHAQPKISIGADLVRARAKMNACLDLLEKVAPVESGWRRYLGTVSLERGPTGKEIRIGGLSAAADATREIATALREADRQPSWPDIDAQVKAVARLYGEASTTLAGAVAYHGRNAHREDEGREAREHHARLREHVQPLVAAHAELQRHLEVARAELEFAELAAYEKAGGRDGRWHIRRAVVEARRVMATLPEKPGPVDVAALDAALTAYESLVSETEAFEAARPGALMGFNQSPRQFLAGMRGVESKIRAVPGGTPLAFPPYLADAQARYQGLAKFADAFLRTAP